MEIIFAYPIEKHYLEYTKLNISNIRIPEKGNEVYYKNNRKGRIGIVDHILYDFAAETITVFIKPIYLDETTIIQADTKEVRTFKQIQSKCKRKNEKSFIKALAEVPRKEVCN